MEKLVYSYLLGGVSEALAYLNPQHLAHLVAYYLQSHLKNHIYLSIWSVRGCCVLTVLSACSLSDLGGSRGVNPSAADLITAKPH